MGPRRPARTFHALLSCAGHRGQSASILTSTPRPPPGIRPSRPQGLEDRLGLGALDQADHTALRIAEPGNPWASGRSIGSWVVLWQRFIMPWSITWSGSRAISSADLGDSATTCRTSAMPTSRHRLLLPPRPAKAASWGPACSRCSIRRSLTARSPCTTRSTPTTTGDRSPRSPRATRGIPTRSPTRTGFLWRTPPMIRATPVPTPRSARRPPRCSRTSSAPTRSRSR